MHMEDLQHVDPGAGGDPASLAGNEGTMVAALAGMEVRR